MRRFLAVTLLSTTLALTTLTSVQAQDSAEAASPELRPAVEAAATPSEDAAINDRAKHSGKRLSLKRSSKRKLAAKQKTDKTETAETAAATTSTDTTSTAAKETTLGGTSLTGESTSSNSDSNTSTSTSSSTAPTANATATSTDATATTSTTETSTESAAGTTEEKSQSRKKLRSAFKPSKHVQIADAAKPATPADPATTKTKGAKSSVNFGQRFASALVGTIIGTPVAAFKKTIVESKLATTDLVGDTDNWFLLAPAGLLGVPAGILSGCSQAPVVAGVNAWKTSGDEPFSAETMYWGDTSK